MNLLYRFLPYFRPYRGSIVLGGLCLLVATPCQLFPPLVWRFIVDTVIIERKVEHLAPALAAMLVVYLVGHGLLVGRTWLVGRMARGISTEVRGDLYRAVQAQSVDYLNDHSPGDLISRATSDVTVLQTTVVEGFDTAFKDLLTFIYAAGIVLWLQPVVGALTLLPLAAVAAVVLGFNSRIKNLYREIRAKLGAVSSKLHENLAGMALIKATAREDFEDERFGQVIDEHEKLSLRGMLARSLYTHGVAALGFLSNVIMIGVGAWFVLKGEFTIGGLIAYRGYWSRLYDPVKAMAGVNEQVQRAGASAERILEVLDAPPAIVDAPDAKEVENVEGSLRFENVCFEYPSNSWHLHELDLEVRPGETLGIVGPSGSGKSTVLGLILRFQEPTHGRITLDGADLRELTQRSLREQIGLVTQELFLFNDTIRNNLRYGRLDATDGELEEAARLANAHEFIQDLAEGYDTVVGERGAKLSGGQRQRLCIARAFVSNPSVLLLDEATASIEPESELIIQSALRRLQAGRTTVIVAHRLTTIRDADRIAVIQDGRVTEIGTHAELMSRDGWYARMYRLQMDEKAWPDSEAFEARPERELREGS